METKREIGYLPEESYLYKYLTAEETLDFFGSLFNLSAADRKKRIDQLLEMVGVQQSMAFIKNRRYLGLWVAESIEDRFLESSPSDSAAVKCRRRRMGFGLSGCATWGKSLNLSGPYLRK